MRVLLLGATGNLGRRVVPALVSHSHTPILLVRPTSIFKLPSLFAPALLSQAIIAPGDATDSAAIKAALLAHDCDAVINVAGNQVLPWREALLPKIARAVVDACVAVGEERGVPLRVWCIGGMGSLRYPGTEFTIQDFLRGPLSAQHGGTEAVMVSVSVEKVRWSLLCVGWMKPAIVLPGGGVEVRTDEMVVKAGEPPSWQDSWVRAVPLVGNYVNILIGMIRSATRLEDVAEFLVCDLEHESEWVGKLLGVGEKTKAS